MASRGSILIDSAHIGSSCALKSRFASTPVPAVHRWFCAVDDEDRGTLRGHISAKNDVVMSLIMPQDRKSIDIDFGVHPLQAQGLHVVCPY